MIWPIRLQHNWRQWDFPRRYRGGKPDDSGLVGLNQAFEYAGSAKQVEMVARLPQQTKTAPIAGCICCFAVQRRVRNFVNSRRCR
jgi:hypothetical protein